MFPMISFNLSRFTSRIAIPLLVFVAVTTLIILHSGVDVQSGVIELMKGLDAASARIKKAGHVIERGNVLFAFINPKNKKGSPEEILKINEKIFDDVMLKQINEPKDFDIDSIRPAQNPDDYNHANATIVALVRNHEATKMGSTLRSFEKQFNAKFKYPYTFINDEPFTDKFKEKIRKYTDAPINFVHIPAEIWNKPEFIDEEREQKAMDKLEELNVAYAKKASYHNMCRFYLWNFFNLPEVRQYKYYWRIEPNVKFFSEVNYDVFKYLEGTGKIYGFTINLYDIDDSIPSLFPETLNFLNQDDNYRYVNENGAFQWITENQQIPKKAKVANGYSTCHFWSNFEIGDMDFFRGEAYSAYVKHLDSTGNFYYERWGDAPVRSLGLALFADKRKIHWFRDIGYHHPPYRHCPNSPNTQGCRAGQFSDGPYNLDQNCMASWIDYEMENVDAIY